MTYIMILWTLFFIISPFFNQKNYKYFLLIVTVMLTYLAYHIVPQKSMDLYRLYSSMDLYRNMGFKWVFQYYLTSNPLTHIYLYFFSLFNNNAIMTATTVFITYFLSFRIFIKVSQRYSISKTAMNIAFWFFMCNFNYFYLISNIRIYLCFAVISYFFYMETVEKKHKILCWIMYIATCYFHYASVPFIILRLLMIVIRSKNRLYYFAILIIPIAVYFGQNAIPQLNISNMLFDTISLKVEGYQDYEKFGIWQFGFSVIRLSVIFYICAYYDIVCHQIDNKMIKISMYTIFSIALIVGLISNFQFILRAPNFIQILVTAPLLVALQRKDVLISNTYAISHTFLTVFVCGESILHFIYLLIYVYNNAFFFG